MGSRRRRGAAAIAAIVVLASSLVLGSRVANAQRATVSCPGAFNGTPLESGPGTRDVDGHVTAICDYKSRPDSSTSQLAIIVKWNEDAAVGFNDKDLCGTPRVDKETNGILESIEIPSAAGKQARLIISGDFLWVHRDRQAEAEKFGLDLLAQVEPEAIALPCQEKRTDEKTCLVTVLDRAGRAVQGVHTSLDVQGGRQEGVTDVHGGTQFPKVKVGDSVIATVTLEDAEHSPPEFRIETEDTPSSVRTHPTTVVQDAPCELKVDARRAATLESEKPGVDKWPDSVEIYERIRQAMRLAEQLGPITYGLPLRVHTFCTLGDFQCAPDKDVIHAVEGRVGTLTSSVSEPFIAIGPTSSLLSYNGRPDNREYHEMGHWQQANLLGGILPIDCPQGQDCTHKGYFVNRSSADSYVEGYATFFSMMVSKHIDLRSFPELFRFYGNYLNLERDKLAWEAGGRYEEFAVAGILLDMEDGPSDYQKLSTNAPELKLDCCNTGKDVAEGLVENKSPEGSGLTAHGVHVIATLPDGKKKDVPTIPSEIPPGGAARVVVPTVGVPPGTQLTATVALGPQNGNDDDQVTVPLKTITQTIAAAHAPDGGPIANMSQLHNLFKSTFGADKNGNGVDDVDEIFVNHGFFDDTDGDQLWKPGDVVGPTAHAAQGSFPAITPRPHAEAPLSSLVPVVTGRTDAQVLVDVEYPEKDAAKSFATVAQPDPDGTMFLDVPPPDSGATVTIVAVAPDTPPVLAGQITASEFWKAADASPGQPAARFTANLGGVAAGGTAPRSSSDESYSKVGVAIGGLLAIGALAVLLFVRSRRWLSIVFLGGAAAALAWAVIAGGSDAKTDTPAQGGVQLAAVNFDLPLGGAEEEGGSSSASSSASSSSSSSETSTTSASSSTPTSISANDITVEGVVDPESSTPGSPPTFAVDGNPDTSWLSGPAAADDNASEFAWKSENHFIISAVRITPTKLPNKSFTSVEINLVADEGETVYSETKTMSGATEIVFSPNVRARAILLVFRGHQDPNGSGFAELRVEGS